MLLQRLADYAREHTDSAPFHRDREFTWRLDLYSDGRPARITDIRQPDAKGKLRGQRHSTPAVTRSSGVAPHLGADDGQYVLGWGDESTKPHRVQQCHEQFVTLHAAWAESTTNDPVAATVRDFYRRREYTAWSPPTEYTAKQGVLLAVDDELVIRHPSLVRFWTEEVARRKGSKNSAPGLCLVCGQHAALVETIPGTVAKRLVPGAGNDLALVSVNELVFGYGLTKGLQHTPICFTCGNAVSAGLTHLLNSERAMTYPRQDSVMAWWVLGAPINDIYDVMPRTADPTAVNRLLNELHSGQLAEAAHQSDMFSDERFCSITLSGNASRIMVREWIDMPLAQVAHNLGRFYDHMLMTSPRENAPVSHGFWNLVLATGRWEQSASRGRYADLTSKSARRPEHIQRDLLTRALRGIPLPPSVLHHVLRRIASDNHIDTARAALLRLALCHPHDKEPDVSPGLDEQCHDTPYVYGRIFAQLEKIQYWASRASDSTLNTTFGDRFLSGAINNPGPALLAGQKLSSAWLRKIRHNTRAPGKADALGHELTELYRLLDNTQALTGYLPPEQQARFVLGYHQQRAHDAQQRRARKAVHDDTSLDTSV